MPAFNNFVKRVFGSLKKRRSPEEIAARQLYSLKKKRARRISSLRKKRIRGQYSLEKKRARKLDSLKWQLRFFEFEKRRIASVFSEGLSNRTVAIQNLQKKDFFFKRASRALEASREMRKSLLAQRAELRRSINPLGLRIESEADPGAKTKSIKEREKALKQLRAVEWGIARQKRKALSAELTISKRKRSFESTADSMAKNFAFLERQISNLTAKVNAMEAQPAANPTGEL